MMRRLLTHVVTALLVAVATAASLDAQGTPTVAIIVRHAEKAATPVGDPPLTEAGVDRAKALATAVAHANVQAIITSQFLRTRETARPTAEARRLTLETIPVTRLVAEHAKAVADAVRKHAGQTVLVVGHSNTVNQIIAALGGPRMPDLCDSQYSNLYTVVLDGTKARLVQGTYGAPSPDPATSCAPMK